MAKNSNTRKRLSNWTQAGNWWVWWYDHSI